MDRDFSILRKNEMGIEPSGEEKILMDDALFVPNKAGLYQVTDWFKVVVTRERLANFYPNQDSFYGVFNNVSPVWKTGGTDSWSPKRALRNKPLNRRGWFTKTIAVRSLVTLTNIDHKDRQIMDGRMTFLSHSAFKAKASMISIADVMRNPEKDLVIPKTIAQFGYQCIDFSSNGNLTCLLDIHHMEQVDKVHQGNPLQIRIKVDDPSTSYLLPLTLPSRFFVDKSVNYFGLAGSVEHQTDNEFLWKLDHIPLLHHDDRNIGQPSLRVYFVAVDEDLYQNIVNAQKWEFVEVLDA